MADFVGNIVTSATSLFQGIITAMGGVGDLIFTTTEAGVINGLTGFGTILSVIIGIPLGSWLFSKLFNWIKSIRVGR